MGSEKINITQADITGYNAQNKGKQTLTITKNGRTATFNVEVTEVPPAARADFIGTWQYRDDNFIYTISETELSIEGRS
jgi:hypothetical protein